MPSRPIVEEAHRPNYPWPEPRARGVVIAARPDAVLVKWDATGGEQWVDKDRIGSKPRDLIRFTGDYAPAPASSRNEQTETP